MIFYATKQNSTGFNDCATLKLYFVFFYLYFKVPLYLSSISKTESLNSYFLS